MGLYSTGTTVSPRRSRRDLALGFEARHPAHGAGDADPKSLGCDMPPSTTAPTTRSRRSSESAIPAASFPWRLSSSRSKQVHRRGIDGPAAGTAAAVGGGGDFRWSDTHGGGKDRRRDGSDCSRRFWCGRSATPRPKSGRRWSGTGSRKLLARCPKRSEFSISLESSQAA